MTSGLVRRTGSSLTQAQSGRHSSALVSRASLSRREHNNVLLGSPQKKQARRRQWSRAAAETLRQRLRARPLARSARALIIHLDCSRQFVVLLVGDNSWHKSQLETSSIKFWPAARLASGSQVVTGWKCCNLLLLQLKRLSSRAGGTKWNGRTTTTNRGHRLRFVGAPLRALVYTQLPANNVIFNLSAGSTSSSTTTSSAGKHDHGSHSLPSTP